MDVASGSLGIYGVAVILGLDPGRDKAGWALTDEAGNLLMSGIFPAFDCRLFLDAIEGGAGLEKKLSPWILERQSVASEGENSTKIFLGDGTCSRFYSEILLERGCRFAFVNERGSTLEARFLYWKLHRPVFWQRFLPFSMRVPPRPLDDLAAWVIALRGIGDLL